MEAAKFNLRSPAVKRILQEIKEIRREASEDFLAEALEENIFEWHFVIRGSPDTEFRGGIYHGRILLPADYPFKPPSFTMLTPNGRFETNTKICLSISSHHPEHWQPSWSVRTALTALTAFMPSPGHGAIGSLDYTKEERHGLAAKSRLAPPSFGSRERQQLSAELHRQMLELHPEDGTPASSPAASSEVDHGQASNAVLPNTAEHSAPTGQSVEPRDAPVQPVVPPDACQTHTQLSAGPSLSAAEPTHSPDIGEQHPKQAQATWEDKGLTLLAFVLVVLIAAIVFRKLLMFSGLDIQAMLTQQ